jgi:hypothetical protein
MDKPSISKIYQNNLLPAITVMCLLSLVLFWIPIIGSFAAGFTGSKKAGNHQTALAASLISALILGPIMFLLSSSMTALPVVGALARTGNVNLSLCFMIPLILGGIAGIAHGK